jgi:hypothetical protein
MKPLPQFIRRRQLAQPEFDRRIRFLQTSRPQTIHQHAHTIRFDRRLIDAFDNDRHSTDLPPVLSYVWPLIGAAAIIMDFSTYVPLGLRLSVAVAFLLVFAGCDAERRKSNAELGLNPQQATGRKLYDNYCDRCHEAYSSHDKKGPALQGIFKHQYLPVSGLPANDERVGEIVKVGRSKMQGFGQVMTDREIQDLLAYLHTL